MRNYSALIEQLQSDLSYLKIATKSPEKRSWEALEEAARILEERSKNGSHQIQGTMH